MGRNKANHPRRKRRELWRDVPESCLRLCMQLAAVDDEGDERAMTVARSGTHDIAVAQAGRGRVSGVSWRTIPAALAPRFLDKVRADGAKGHDAEVLDQLQAYLKDRPRGVLVMGSCWADTRAMKANLS